MKLGRRDGRRLRCLKVLGVGMAESLDLSIRFRGGDASANRLDMYDGAAALFGISKVLLISTHFLLNERVIFQAPAAKGVSN